MAIEQHLSDYKETIDKVDSDIQQYEGDLTSKKAALKLHVKHFEDRNWLVKLILGVPYLFTKWSYESAIEELETLLSKAPDRKTRALRVLVLESARDEMVNGEDASKLMALEQEHTLLKKVFDMTVNTEEAGAEALREIQSAIKSLNDAEAFETLDLVTNNKLISAASTAQNFSACDATRQANRALQRFQHRLNEQQSYREEIQHDPLIEALDFAIDIMWEGGVLDALGSLFSLIALSDTKSKLKQLHSELTPLVKAVTDERKALAHELKSHNTKLLDFKASSRQKVVPILKSHGVNVSVEFAASIKDLYAPSATAT